MVHPRSAERDRHGHPERSTGLESSAESAPPFRRGRASISEQTDQRWARGFLVAGSDGDSPRSPDEAPLPPQSPPAPPPLREWAEGSPELQSSSAQIQNQRAPSHLPSPLSRWEKMKSRKLNKENELGRGLK
ncbi:hypothetical protein CLOM_g20545 [Closterium sp. NIES-68]|nr:hypothetical protein CLOM_g20545 [Closterium sp. NIES-68]